jgi:hypothetical protein
MNRHNWKHSIILIKNQICDWKRLEGNILRPKKRLSLQVINIRIIPFCVFNFLYNNHGCYSNQEENVELKSYTGVKKYCFFLILFYFLFSYSYFLNDELIFS